MSEENNEVFENSYTSLVEQEKAREKTMTMEEFESVVNKKISDICHQINWDEVIAIDVLVCVDTDNKNESDIYVIEMKDHSDFYKKDELLAKLKVERVKEKQDDDGELDVEVGLDEYEQIDTLLQNTNIKNYQVDNIQLVRIDSRRDDIEEFTD